MRLLNRIFIGLFSFSFVLLALPSAAHAQSSSSGSFNAAISPLPILLDAKPGTSVTTNLRVSNPGSQPEQLKVSLKTFSQDGPNGLVTLHDPTAADDYVNWVHFDRTVFDAPPGEWQTIKMTVDLPASASFGYYFAVEFSSANNQTARVSTNGTKIQGAVASFVLLNANVPGEKRQMQVTSFTADHKIYEFLPVNFTVHLHNSGNVYGTAAGNIFIMRGGKQVASLVVNGNKGLVLPGSNRVFTVAWNDGFPVYKPVTDASGQPVNGKDGQPKQKLTWNFSQASKLRFGHYTAQLALVYNDGTRDVPITGQVSFWVVPWRIIAVILFILVFVTIGFWSTFKKFGSAVKRKGSGKAKKAKDEK